MGYQTVKDKLARGETVLLDGGVGTEILRRGVYWRSHGIEQRHEVVRQVHADYIAAGADVVRTYTFQLNRRAYLNLFHGLEHMRRIGPPGLERKANQLVRRAVELAREAREQAGKAADSGALAGVISPLQHCFRPDLTPPLHQGQTLHRDSLEGIEAAGGGFILL